MYPTNDFSCPDIACHSGAEIPNLDEPEISHFLHFIDCARSRRREDLICEVEQGHRSTSLCHLANISYRDDGKIECGPEAESIPADGEANRWLIREYRQPNVVPDQV